MALVPMAPGKPRVLFRVMENGESLGLRALRREFGRYGEAGLRSPFLRSDAVDRVQMADLTMLML